MREAEGRGGEGRVRWRDLISGNEGRKNTEMNE